MNWKQYLKEKAPYLLFLCFAVGFASMLLSVLHVSTSGGLFICFLFVLALLIPLGWEFFQKRRFYEETRKKLEQLDKKFLLSELVDAPDFWEGEFLCEALRQSNKAMNDEIARYQRASKEYREYIELWIHEVKTPIASSRLIMENHKSETTKNLSIELDTIDYYVEQALYYSRSDSAEKDYIVKETSLKELVNSVVRKNAKAFIREKVQVYTESLDITVYTDSKWLEFIVNQLVVNAIKCRRDPAQITISAQEREQSVALYIADNGIGIPAKDLPRVMEKGFTGDTGRGYAKSTGMGLYLCKTLCDKLGLSFALSSVEKIGTTAEIVFPKGKFSDLNE